MSSELKERIRADLRTARKARNRLERTVLSTLLSEIRNREIEIGEEVDDDEVRAVVARAIKQRKEASGEMARGGREELAAREEREAEILAAYLPPPLSEDDVRTMVREAIEEGADGIGPVMGRIMPRIRGRFDGREANRIAREELER